jgi:glycosyltransferase involved in cell wall biosynthesis
MTKSSLKNTSKKTHNLVSIIIPVFNQEKYVFNAINSALTQEYLNIEVVVVDDGSTDRSFKIIKDSFGKKINLIHQKNLGPSAAINKGIKNSKGEFICLLGGDDLCSPDRVSKQLEKILKDKADIVFCRPQIINEYGKNEDDTVFENFSNSYTTDASAANPVENSKFFKQMFLHGNTLCAPSAFFKREIVSLLGEFDESLIHLQDYDYWLKALSNDLTFTFHNKRLVFYRRHPNNLSSEENSSKSLNELTYILDRILDLGRPSILRNCFSDFVFPEINKNKPISLFEKSLILLSHPNDLIKRRGYDIFLRNGKDKSFSNARKNGFDQFKFLLNLFSEDYSFK